MKTDSIIFRKLTATEFKAITNTIQSQGGGSQTYIDFPKGKITDENLQSFFNGTGTAITNGFEWKFEVSSPSLNGATQSAVISARRQSSNSLREQNNANRLEAWKPENSGFPTSEYDEENSPIVLYILKSTDNTYWAGWFYKNDCNDTWFMSKGLSKMIWQDCGYIELDNPIDINPNDYHWPFGKLINKPSIGTPSLKDSDKFIHALKTKPFLLLAGISGTGKSRKVKELAYMTCPANSKLAEDPTSPGNYYLIEVKPNWHDSTELLGYYSNLSGKYDITPFMKFVYKATINQDIPFFVCLDEMNLAPVEQYFAEYLSVLETRVLKEGKIESAELLKKELFENYPTHKGEEPLYEDPELEVFNHLKSNGLRLPENLFIVGTVNMDDTTHQFSRKVIDRAFTIEMNGDDLSTMFNSEDTLAYSQKPLPLSELKPSYVQAADALTGTNIAPFKQLIIDNVPVKLGKINEILQNTPFKVSFRVQNELVLYLSTLIDENKPEDNKVVESLIDKATLVILLEKILPRVQGDEKLLGDTLKHLKEHVETNFIDHKDSDVYQEVIAKLTQMSNRLDSAYFANFF